MCPQDGSSPVRIAAESGHVEMTELLIDRYHCSTQLDDVSTYRRISTLYHGDSLDDASLLPLYNLWQWGLLGTLWLISYSHVLTNKRSRNM